MHSSLNAWHAQAAGPTLSQFCRKCGSPMVMQIPPREKELRHVCSSCAYVDYYNPKMVGFIMLALSASSPSMPVSPRTGLRESSPHAGGGLHRGA